LATAAIACSYSVLALMLMNVLRAGYTPSNQ
jgi:hypothetical protein